MVTIVNVHKHQQVSVSLCCVYNIVVRTASVANVCRVFYVVLETRNIKMMPTIIFIIVLFHL